MRLLIADDSAALRERLLEMLSRLNGVDVVGQARDVAEALAAIRTLRPDAVILDIRMPGGSGLDVLRELKRTRPSTVAIMLTHHAEYRQKCAELGADYFLPKVSASKDLMDVCMRVASEGRPS